MLVLYTEYPVVYSSVLHRPEITKCSLYRIIPHYTALYPVPFCNGRRSDVCFAAACPCPTCQFNRPDQISSNLIKAHQIWGRHPRARVTRQQPSKADRKETRAAADLRALTLLRTAYSVAPAIFFFALGKRLHACVAASVPLRPVTTSS